MDFNLIYKELGEIPEYKIETIVDEDLNKVGNFTNLKVLTLNPDGINLKTLKFLINPNNKNITNITKLCGDLNPIKCGYTTDNRLFITPYGGPTLTEMEEVPNNSEFMIKKIYYISDKEFYIVELQKKD